MNARKKNDVWRVQNLIWPNGHKFHEKIDKKSRENKEAKETCQDLINLTPETEKTEPEVQDSVDTVDNVDRLRQETADLLRKTGLSDLENESSLGTIHTLRNHLKGGLGWVRKVKFLFT